VRPPYALVSLLAGAGLPLACADDPPPVVPLPFIAEIVRADEGHLTEVRQLTFGGDNDAARWAWGGDQVILQARALDTGRSCPRVTRTTLADPPARVFLLEGEMPSFLPGDGDVVYAASASCAKNRGERGDGLALEAGLDLFRARADGSAPRRLTETAGYDAEASVCGKSGAIVFTSMRDGDPDLYRMDADGRHLVRLTATAGYDGGAVFDADCTHIAWQAWHPQGKALEDYQKELAERVVRPPTLELWVAQADGTDARQVTYLDGRSWAPTFYPSQRRLLFASTFGGETARDVDLWAIDLDGTNLERVTTAPSFDGSPSFSPDGRWLAFTSARATQVGKSDANVFVARWSGLWRHVEERPADHLMGDAAWLADRAREGRALGSKGLDEAGAYVERSFQSFGLAPGGEEGFRQGFDVTTQVSGQTALVVAGVPIAASAVRALGFSASMEASGPLVFVASEDDYARLDVKGAIVVVRGGASPRQRAWLAHQHGAAGFLGVDEEALSDPAPESSEGLPAAMVSSGAMAGVLARVLRGERLGGHLAVTLAPETGRAFNVVGRWGASVPNAQRLPGVIVLGAHYDGRSAESPGADDNASGTAALLQVARSLGEKKPALRRDILLVAFSGEEQGAAGATAFVKKPPGGLAARDLLALVDLDMVGRMRDDTLQVFGEDSAAEWTDLLSGACSAAHVECVPATGGGLGGADRRPFFEGRIPGVHLFTGVHGDDHKPTDTADLLNATGMAQVARIAEHLALDLSDLGGRLDFLSTAAVPGDGESRGFGASLGIIPDAAGPANGEKGVLLAGVRPHGPADQAGLRRGDVLRRLGGHLVAGTDDVKFVMTQSKPGVSLKGGVLRDGKELTVDITPDAPARR
jgi:Tol biopolymer transport system component